MKKSSILLVSFCAVFVSTSAFAINFDKIAGAVGSAAAGQGSGGKNPLEEVTGKIEQRVDKLVGGVEERINKYEKKIDAYEKKLDQAEKAIDRVTSEINNFDKSQIEKYLKIAKLAVIGLVLIFVLMLVLVIAIFVQMIRVSAALKDLKAGRK